MRVRGFFCDESPPGGSSRQPLPQVCFGVQGSGYRGLGFKGLIATGRVQGLGLRVQGLGYRGLGLKGLIATSE